VKTVDQLSGGGRYPHEDCGESCVASVLYDAGKADTVPDIETFDFGDQDNPADGTGGQVIVDRLDRAGIASHIDRRPYSIVLAESRARNLNRVFVAIFSDSYGNPTPGSGLGHWILWGRDWTTVGDMPGWDSSIKYMQPVGGKLMNYADMNVATATQGYPNASYCVVVDAVIGTQPNSSSAGDPDMRWMLAGDTDDAGTMCRRVTIHGWYHQYMGREIENDTAMQDHLTRWKNSGAEAAQAFIYNSQEAVKYRAGHAG
jgi:hypothetical protein